MYCSNCGTQSNGKFCPECGQAMAGTAVSTPATAGTQPQPSAPNVVYIPVQTQKRGFNGWGVAAFVFSILSYFYSAFSMLDGNKWICAATLAVQIVLIVLAFRAAKKKYLGRGLTIAALVICCINAYLLFFIFVFKDTLFDIFEEYSSLFGNSIADSFGKLI